MPCEPIARARTRGRSPRQGAGRRCEHLERKSLQSVAREQGDGLSKRAMAGRRPATQIVVVHRRQVVVDERVCVDELDRARRGYEVLILAVQRFTSGEHENGTDALASGEHRVSHRFVQSLRRPRCRRQRSFEHRVDAFPIA